MRLAQALPLLAAREGLWRAARSAVCSTLPCFLPSGLSRDARGESLDARCCAGTIATARWRHGCRKAVVLTVFGERRLGRRRRTGLCRRGACSPTSEAFFLSHLVMCRECRPVGVLHGLGARCGKRLLSLVSAFSCLIMVVPFLVLVLFLFFFWGLSPRSRLVVYRTSLPRH